MTKEEFHSLGYGSCVRDHYGYCGHVTTLDFRFGYVHFQDKKKKSHYGYHYTELDIMQ